MAKSEGYSRSYRATRRAFGRPIVPGSSVVANAVTMGNPQQVRAALSSFSVGQLRRAEKQYTQAAEKARARGWTDRMPGLATVRAELRRRGL